MSSDSVVEEDFRAAKYVRGLRKSEKSVMREHDRLLEKTMVRSWSVGSFVQMAA